MTREDIDTIIKTICPNDEDYEKPIISPKYLKQELEQLALEQEPCEDRMKYVQETVNTMLNACTTNSIKDKVFRNAARFVQNAIDGKEPDFEKIDEPEPCEDAVSRQAIKEKKIYSEERHEYIIPIAYIDWLPSVAPVTPKQRTGKWIGHREHCENLGVMPSGLGAYEWCSNCDCGIDVREWHRNHYNFCPNCGAKMEGVSE